MSNFVPPLKVNIQSKVKSGEKDESKGTLRSSAYNIAKTFTGIGDILKNAILFSDKK